MATQWIFDDFPRNFDAEILDESPYEEPIYFSDDPIARSRDGLYVRVHRQSGHPSWIAKFAYGTPGFPMLSGLVACPNPDCLLVVSCGAAAYVSVPGPTCLVIPAAPVIQVASDATAGMVFVADNNRIVALDDSGVRWHSQRIVPDELHIEAVRDSFIEVSGFDPAEQSVIKRKVTLFGGTVVR